MKKIILAVDYNHDLERTLTQALSYAQVCDAEIIPVHAIEHPPALYRVGNENLLKKKFDAVLEKTKTKLGLEGLMIDELVFTEGKVMNVMLAATRSLDADLIMIGSGRDERGSLGVIARRLVRQSHIPVWIVDSHFDKCNSILCPIDYSDHSQLTLRVAMLMARKYQVPLHILHVSSEYIYQYAGVIEGSMTDVAAIEAASGIEQPNLEETECAQLDDFLANFNLQGTQLETHRRSGRCYKNILEVAEEVQADLLVMGTKGHSILAAGLLGGTIERILDQMPCSVLSVGTA